MFHLQELNLQVKSAFIVKEKQEVLDDHCEEILDFIP